MMPNNALAELQDLVDSDSDEEEPSPAPAPHVPNLKACEGPVSDEGDIQSLKDVSAVSMKAKQRNSISLNTMMPNNALAELQDLVDSDSDEEEPSPAPAPHVPNLKACGGPEHRPLVGGFAAAAYEAARVDYYKKRGMNVRGHQPPRPPRSAPRYP